jgi:YcxB-like protein
LDSLESTPQEPAGGHDDAAFTLRWTFECADLEDALRGQPVFRRLRRLRRWLLVLALLAGILTAFRPTWSNGRTLALMLLLLLLFETMPRLVAWQQWRANPQLHGAEMGVTVSATGMRVHSPGAVSDCAWEVFRQVHETDRAFLLSFSPKASSPVLVLPKRALSGQADIAALGALLHRKIDGGKTSTSGRPSRGTP